MEKIKVGDKVRVFDVNGRRMGQPDGGWEGEVVRVGSKLAGITYGGYAPKMFRLDTGSANDSYGHQSFLTIEQAEGKARKDAAVQILWEHKVILDFGHKLTTEQIEALAEVARTFTDDATQH